MFVIQGFFELFEVLLSYFSNTLSFVRVGAFAVSHAAMMEVVLMLAGAEAGSPNWLVVVLGNLFVCGLEGLVVASRCFVWNTMSCSAVSTAEAAANSNLTERPEPDGCAPYHHKCFIREENIHYVFIS